MEESDFLTDLLECSVCFETLDIQSKVLPCQHTFCKRCLEGIVVTHKELRCPECRVLVETKVNELPPNILLVRLLDGLKNNAKQRASSVQKSPSLVLTPSQSQQTANVHEVRTPARYHHHSPEYGSSQSREPIYNSSQLSQSGLHQHRNVSLTKHLLTTPNPSHAKAIYTYDGKQEGDLKFKKGDTIILRKRIDSNWFHGELNGKQGFLPASYIQVLTPPPNAIPPHCKAIHDFRVTGVEEKDCLPFGKSDIITVIRRIDDDWAEGKLGDRLGIFPISYVEMNASAKALMKLASFNCSGPSRTVPPTPVTSVLSTDQPAVIQVDMPVAEPAASAHINDDSSTSSPSSPSSVPCTPSSSSSSSSCSISLPNGVPSQAPLTNEVMPASNQESAVTKARTVTCDSNQTSSANEQSASRAAVTVNKRHSLCAPSSTSGLPFVVHQRSNSHHHESSPHRRSMELLNDRSTTAPDVVSSNWPSDFNRSLVRNTSASLVPKQMHTTTSPPCVPVFYVALFNYKAQKNDELELRKNEFYVVTEKCQDGWFKGSSLRTGASGVFPGNYVQIAKCSLPHHDGSSSGLTAFSQSRPNPQGVHDFIPCRSKPMVHGVSHAPVPMTSGAVATVYARPARPVTLAATSKNCVASSILDWARNVAPPPGRPPRSKTPPTRKPGESPTHSSSTTSSPSPQWPPVKVAATRNVPHASTSFGGSALNISVTKTPLTADESIVASLAKNGQNGSEKKEIKEKKVSLMKRWTKKSKSKSPPPTANFYCDNEAYDDTSPRERTNVLLANASVPAIHIRSGSCPSEALGGRGGGGSSCRMTGKEEHHEPVNRCSKQQQQVAAPPVTRQRYRCVVPYPPNSDYELELQLDDVVFVHRKRDDGWLKGTHQRTGKTGLFPSSFVEAF
ncbi:E3 ubiquitin-protein ligase SH3RF3 [Halotydeus destructor]|nr:E3 ubiquitin-protein ligase SH3RF3 [Halotydeus destructor]